MSLNARSYLVDAGFLSLHYSGNETAKQYFDRILDSRATGYVSEVNLAEFYYKVAEQEGLDTAETWYLQVRQAGFQIIAPNATITRGAARWKVKRRDLSLADCFALSTMEENAQVLLTTDTVLSKIKGIRAVFVSPK